MTDAAWESLSNQAVAAAGLVYFLALLVHLAEWASLRKVPVAAASASRESVDVQGGLVVATGPDAPRDAEDRIAFLGRLGYLMPAWPF